MAMKVLVVGATGGSGRAAIDELLRRGHDVTGFARRVERLDDYGDRVRAIRGDATDPDAVDRAVPGQDAVIITLGISENAIRVRLGGSAGTPMDIRSRGTRTVMESMRRNGVRRLVVQTSYGVGPTRDRIGLVQRLVFLLLLRPQIADTERQDSDVRSSGLDWVIAQPVNLTDEALPGLPFASTRGDTDGTKVARARVGRFLVAAVESDMYLGHTVSLSGSGAALSATGERPEDRTSR
jgi:uncharacterized protein YbjT (DUF2867 family)